MKRNSSAVWLVTVGLLIILTAGTASAATVTNSISFTGNLTNSAGTPLTGTYYVTFRLYNVASGGTAVATDTHWVTANKGQYTTTLSYPWYNYNGQGLWVGVQRSPDPELIPRTALSPVAYTMGLRPGSVMLTDYAGGYGFTIQNIVNTGNGLAVSTAGTNTEGIDVLTKGANSYGIGVRTGGGSSRGVSITTYNVSSPAVYAKTTGANSYGMDVSTANSGSRGVNVSTSGSSSPGVYTGTTGQFSPAVYAQSSNANSDAVYAKTTGANSYGVDVSTANSGSRGVNISTTGSNSHGVYTATTGPSSNGIESRTRGPFSNAVYARTDGDTAYAVNALTTGKNSIAMSAQTNNNGSYGIYAKTSGIDSHGIYLTTSGKNSDGLNITTTGESSNGIVVNTKSGSGIVARSTDHYTNYGVFGSSEYWAGVLGSSRTGYGVSGYSTASYALYGETGSQDHRYGVYTPDYLYAKGTQVPAADVAEYMPVSGDLAPGTVVIIGDDGKLRKSAAAYDTKVAGIISTDPGVTLGTKEAGNPGEAQIAVAGRVPCRVDATKAPIHAGDLLTTSDNPGYAMKATDPKIGTVLGKAMGSLESGTGTIEVLVTLQ